MEKPVGKEKGTTPASTLGESPILNNRVKFLVAGVLLLAGLVYFVFVTFQGSTVYYLTVPELLERGTGGPQTMVRVSGKLMPDSFQRGADGLRARFEITDGTKALEAEYRGVIPDLFFNPASSIVLEGTYSAGRPFQTENIIVKCPSKYSAAATEG
ncbi:MAG: cytochrome c maturation protein CcmE [Chloroflexi bacterium]|nr:cytochrome c maturation protein CcmE [Chloroflexota bacterium]